MGKARAFCIGLAMIALATVSGTAGSAQAQQSLNFIRDAEIEHIIRTFARPIFDAAGIDADAVTFALVRDRTINAFVAGGMNIFIYTGLLQEVDSPEQLIGVIAHETGHIAGGHLSRLRQQLAQAQTQSIIAMILGVGVYKDASGATPVMAAVKAAGGGKFTINGSETSKDPALTGLNWTEVLAAELRLPAPCAAQTEIRCAASLAETSRPRASPPTSGSQR